MEFKPFKIGKYLLLERLATGGMAEVYRAKASGAGGFEKQLAIKRILPSYTANEEFQRMFEYEARLSSMLTHANIVQIYDFVKAQDTYLLAMEYVNGKNLRQVVNKLRKLNFNLPIECSLYIMNETCKGLDYAHSKKDELTNRPLNIIHRDMSPQNVMISYEGAVKIVDFGIAKAKDKVDETRSGVIKGKFGYMSPEQANGQIIDLHSDIFSTGIILWELLTGKRLFSAEGDLATLKLIQDCVVAKPSLHNPKVSPELERIVMKALSKDVSQRYQTAGLMQRQIQEYLHKHYPTLTGSELGGMMTKIFEEEIRAEAKRFEQLHRQSIPFSQGTHKKPQEDEENIVAADNDPIDSALDGSVTSAGSEHPTQITFVDEDEEEKASGAAEPSIKSTPGNSRSLNSLSALDPSLRDLPSQSTEVKTQAQTQKPVTVSELTAKASISQTIGGDTKESETPLERTQVSSSAIGEALKAQSELSKTKTEKSSNRLQELTATPVSKTLTKTQGDRSIGSEEIRMNDRTMVETQITKKGGGAPELDLPKDLRRRSRPRNPLTQPFEEREERPEERKGSKTGIVAAVLFFGITGYLYHLLWSGGIPVRVDAEDPRVVGSCDPTKDPKCPATTKVEAPTAEPVTPATTQANSPINCEVKFETDPPGAKVVVDGEEKLLTPGTILAPCGSNINYTLTLNNYETISENIVVKKNTGRISKQFKKSALGNLEITVNRRVQVFSNTDHLGDAEPGVAFTIPLKADVKHKLTFKNDIFGINTVRVFTVEEGKVTRATVRLDDPVKTPQRR